MPLFFAFSLSFCILLLFSVFLLGLFLFFFFRIFFCVFFSFFCLCLRIYSFVFFIFVCLCLRIFFSPSSASCPFFLLPCFVLFSATTSCLSESLYSCFSLFWGFGEPSPFLSMTVTVWTPLLHPTAAVLMAIFCLCQALCPLRLLQPLSS